MKKLIFCNQKNYLKTKDVEHFMEVMKEHNSDRLVIFPIMPFLLKYKENGFNVGSQNTAPYNIKAITGEVNASQLKDMGIKYALVGHSERRKYCKEDNKQISRKLKLLIKRGIVPILCVGETSNDYDEGITSAAIKRQLDEALIDIDELSTKELMIAYEPVWAIGTGKTPTNAEILKVIAFIRKELKDRYKDYFKILYGGSVNDSNIENLNKIDMLDGYLMGSFATKAEDLITILEKTKK